MVSGYAVVFPFSRSFLVFLSFLSFATATCYYPNGTAITDPVFQPSLSTLGAVSMCCKTARPDGKDVCLSNGLCHNPCNSVGVCDGGRYWRTSCTDSSWRSPFCQQACTNTSSGGTPDGNVLLTQCSTDGRWCCGVDLTSEICCAMDDRFFLAATIGLSVSSTSTSTSTSSTATSSTTLSSSASSSTRTAAAPASHWDTGKKIGLGAGLGVGVPIFVAILIFRRRYKNQRQNTMKRSAEPGTAYTFELGNKATVHEAPIMSDSDREYRKPELDATGQFPRNDSTYHNAIEVP